MTGSVSVVSRAPRARSCARPMGALVIWFNKNSPRVDECTRFTPIELVCKTQLVDS